MSDGAMMYGMFSCVNYERGCRGRSNYVNGRCDSCISLNLHHPSATAPVAVPSASPSPRSSTSSSPSDPAYSALTNGFASLARQSPLKRH